MDSGITFPCVFCGKPNPTRSARKSHNPKCVENRNRPIEQERARLGRIRKREMEKMNETKTPF